MKAREADRACRAVLQQHKLNVKADAIEKKQKAEAKLPPVVEKLTETILVSVPSDVPQPELPAVIAAIQYYITTAVNTKAKAWSSMRKNYRRELTVVLHILTDPSNIFAAEVMHRVLDVPIFFDREKLPRSIADYDMYFRFDQKTLATFRNSPKFHAASAYGILLGCEAQSMYDIPVEKIVADVVDKVEVDILVIDDAFFNYKKTWEWIGTAVPDLKVSRVIAYMNLFPAMIAAIASAKLIVGPTSMYTYFACCMRKPVFEIYDPAMSKSWLSKWSNKLYMMHTSTPDMLDKEQLLKGVGRLWTMARSKQLVPLDQTDATLMVQ